MLNYYKNLKYSNHILKIIVIIVEDKQIIGTKLETKKIWLQNKMLSNDIELETNNFGKQLQFYFDQDRKQPLNQYNLYKIAVFCKLMLTQKLQFQLWLASGLALLVRSAILYQSTESSSASQKYQLTINGNHHVASLLATNSSLMAQFKFVNSSTKYSKMCVFSNGSNTQIRTSYLNTNQSISQFIVFNTSLIYVYYNKLNGSKCAFKTDSSVKIVDAIFGNNFNQIFSLFIQNSTFTPIYTFNLIVNGTVTKRYQLQVPVSYQFNKMLFNFRINCFFIHFKAIVIVYAYKSTNPKMLTPVYIDNYTETATNQTNLSNIDMDISLASKMFLYSTSTEIHLVNTSNFKYIRSYNISSMLNITENVQTPVVFSTKFLSHRYILLNTNQTIYQYDIEENKIISSKSLRNSGQLVLSILNISGSYSDKVVAHRKQGISYASRDYYTVGMFYFCNSGSSISNGGCNTANCLPSYSLSQSNFCSKKIRMYQLQNGVQPLRINKLFTPNQTTSSNTNYTNQIQAALGNQLSDNQSNSLNASVSTANDSHFPALISEPIIQNQTNAFNINYEPNNTNNSVFLSAPNQSLLNPQISQVDLSQSTGLDDVYAAIQSETVKSVAITIGKSLTFASMRITPKFLLSLSCFLDDLWYYRYHRTNYPQIMRQFMVKVDLANQIRFAPWFFDFLDSIRQKLSGHGSGMTDQNQNYRKYLDYYQASDPDEVYFMLSSQDVYKQGLITNILFYLCLKLVHLLLYFIANKLTIFQSIRDFVERQTRWWTLIVSVLQMNMVRLAFACALQLSLPSSFHFANKFNQIASILTHFSLLVYSFCFYILIFSSYPQNSSKILLTRCRFTMSSFFFQSLYIVLRNLLRSFVHGFLISHYQLQISALFILDLPFLVLALKMRSYFCNKFTFVLCFFYSLLFAVYDLYFVIQSFSSQSSSIKKNSNRQLFSFILIMCFISISVLISIGLLVVELANILKKLWNKFFNNSINPNLNLKQGHLQNQAQQNQSNLKESNSVKNKTKEFVNRSLKIKGKTNYESNSSWKKDNNLQINYSKKDVVSTKVTSSKNFTNNLSQKGKQKVQPKMNQKHEDQVSNFTPIEEATNYQLRFKLAKRIAEAKLQNMSLGYLNKTSNEQKLNETDNEKKTWQIGKKNRKFTVKREISTKKAIGVVECKSSADLQRQSIKEQEQITRKKKLTKHEFGSGLWAFYASSKKF